MSRVGGFRGCALGLMLMCWCVDLEVCVEIRRLVRFYCHIMLLPSFIASGVTFLPPQDFSPTLTTVFPLALPVLKFAYASLTSPNPNNSSTTGFTFPSLTISLNPL